MKLWVPIALVSFVLSGCAHVRPRQAMCTYAGLENLPATSAECVAPAPPPPPPAPLPVMCPYPGLGGIQITDPACVAPPPPMMSSGPDVSSIYFAPSSSVLDADGGHTIDEIVVELKANPRRTARVEGNDEPAHTEDVALRLSKARAVQVKSRLILSGIAGSRIDVIPYGKDRPVCGDKTADCRRENRRVDVELISEGTTGNEVGEITAPTIDSLPWPPPKPSIKETLPANLCHDVTDKTLQGSWNLIHAAFERAGFPEDERTFAIGKNEGFAMLGRMEAINDDASPKASPARWGNPLATDQSAFSVGEWFHDVFGRVTGRYRVIAIVMTLRPMSTTVVAPTFKQIDAIADAGISGAPPSAMGSSAMAANVPCYALIYELERPAIPANTKMVYPSVHTAREHLLKAHLWNNRQLGIR